MMTLELASFDRTGALFLVFGALALIRERNILPFALVAAGSLFQGPIAAVLVAALVVWHRFDRSASRWIQIKDMLALLFILGSSLSDDVLRAFLMVFGFFFMTVNVGGGLLGTLPALLLLRQYCPQPEYLELALGGSAIYWVAAEIFRFTKPVKEREILAYLEAAGALLLMVNFRNDIEKIFGDTLFAGLGGVLLLLELTLFFWMNFRPAGFRALTLNLRGKMISILTAGAQWIRGREPWAGIADESPALGFDQALEQVFYLILMLLVPAVFFLLTSKGGLG